MSTLSHACVYSVRVTKSATGRWSANREAPGTVHGRLVSRVQGEHAPGGGAVGAGRVGTPARAGTPASRPMCPTRLVRPHTTARCKVPGALC